MSAIDTMDHTHVAFFFSLPVYWINEIKPLSSLTDFDYFEKTEIGPTHISIGGGSGEHRALVINMEAALYEFTKNCLYEDELIEMGLNDVDNKCDFDIARLKDKLREKYLEELNESKESIDHYHEILDWDLDTNQWELNSFVKLASKLNGVYQKGNLDKTLESRILDAVALFVIYEMPLEHCIKSPIMIELAKCIKSNEWSNVIDHDWHNNFQCFEKTKMGNCAGRVIKDGKVIQSYSLEEWKIDNNYFSYKKKFKHN
jgi:hypothetical protein